MLDPIAQINKQTAMIGVCQNVFLSAERYNILYLNVHVWRFVHIYQAQCSPHVPLSTSCIVALMKADYLIYPWPHMVQWQQLSRTLQDMQQTKGCLCCSVQEEACCALMWWAAVPVTHTEFLCWSVWSLVHMFISDRVMSDAHTHTHTLAALLIYESWQACLRPSVWEWEVIVQACGLSCEKFL